MHHVHICPYILYRDNDRQYHKGQIIKMRLPAGEYKNYHYIVIPSVVKYNNIFDARQKANDTLEIDYYISDPETSNLIKSNPPLRIKTPSSSNGIEPTESTEITEWVEKINEYPFTQEMLDWDNTPMIDSKK